MSVCAAKRVVAGWRPYCLLCCAHRYSSEHADSMAESIADKYRCYPAHTGQEITYEQMLNCPHEMAPNIAEFSYKGPAPVMPDAEGKYPVPIPGVTTEREYGKA